MSIHIKLLAAYRTSQFVCALRRSLVCILFLGLLCSLDGLAQALNRSVVESQVKAAYLYKFGGYVDWPEHAFPAPESPLTIGVVGADPLADELLKIVASHTVNGRSINVRKIQADDAMSDVNILFVGGTNRDSISTILASTRGKPILIVTETDSGMIPGSMINFVLLEGRVRFEAAPKAARQNNLLISARLLAAALHVVQEAL